MLTRVTEKKERSLGVKLFLKAERCNSPKCVTVRRPQRPGVHGSRRGSSTDYKKQLQEKQKIQIYFGLNNQQMRQLFSSATKREQVLETLFQRLDQVVFALGFAQSPRIARQLISHGHILVNGRKVTVASYHVTIGDTIVIRMESRSKKIFEGVRERLQKYTPPSWLSLNGEQLEGKCVALSTSVDTQFPFDASLVGQFYAR